MPAHICLGWLPLHTCHLTHKPVHTLLSAHTITLLTYVYMHAPTQLYLYTLIHAYDATHRQTRPSKPAPMHRCARTHTCQPKCIYVHSTQTHVHNNIRKPAAIPHTHAYMYMALYPHVHLHATPCIHACARTYTIPLYIYPSIYPTIST